MNSEAQRIIDHMTAVVDTYHSQHHHLPALIELRRDLAVHLFRLTAHIKQAYGKKSLSYVYRKYAIAREISRAIEEDKSATKKRPMNMLEAQTESLDHVLQRRKQETEDESDYELISSMIDSTKQVLSSMQQEIADLRHEQNHTNYMERMAVQERAKNQPTAA
jgi:hypothetical protein